MLDMRLARISLQYDRVEKLPDTPDLLAKTLHRWGVSSSPQEVGWVLSYGATKNIHTFTEVARGGPSKLPIHLPTLLGAVLASGTDRFAFIHSHPGGSAEPSDQDLDVTEAIAEGAASCGLYLEDHFIVTGDPTKWCSLAKRGLYVPAKQIETAAARYGSS